MEATGSPKIAKHAGRCDIVVVALSKKVIQHISMTGFVVFSLALSLSQVAILIPFRNRHEHLPILFQHLVPMLQRQRLQFAFYVIEQVHTYTFDAVLRSTDGLL